MTALSAEQVELLVHNQHPDPFGVLGSHLYENAGRKHWAVRTVQPQAREVFLVNLAHGTEYPLQNDHSPDFFETVLDRPPFSYQFRVVDEGGESRLLHDPYAFRDHLLTGFDLYLFGEGNHHYLYEKLGAHPLTLAGVAGVYFAVWAPNARNVSVIGDFDHWDGRAHQMLNLDHSGVWTLFIPGVQVGEVYKYEVKDQAGHIYEKADPFGFHQELRPRTASVVADLSTYTWGDRTWLNQRQHQQPHERPVAVYEVHLGSWRVVVEEENRFFTYRELAKHLIPYVQDMGFTHIELMPITEYPFDGSWGYQVTGYFAPTARYGSPTDFMYFVDQCHQAGIGVILDWVPAHFPKDAHGLRQFDGTALYEYDDPRIGEHLTWGTLVFNYGRHEVRNFLLASALFWFDKYHIDGIRVDAVAAMLYRDYDRPDGSWFTNKQGGREHLEAIDFLRQLNTLLFKYHPGILMIAEESTAWPSVSAPVDKGGLGFNLKWNMGWMHDTLAYFSTEPGLRTYNHNLMTFSITYITAENYVLALSHDEVVHLKGSLINKMPGDLWQKMANVRTLLGYMYGHPGKKSLFMGMELGQWREWDYQSSLDWHVLEQPAHRALQHYVADLNELYRQEPCLWRDDYHPDGFSWIDCHDIANSVVAFIRRSGTEHMVIVCNFTPQFHPHYRIGVPESGFYQELLNSDAGDYWGSGKGNMGGRQTDAIACHQLPHSLNLVIPPLAVLILKRRV
ncbi:1,4-alpha-glucan branching protein GlgB [Candidatus Cyanaurora vandensis]|uniref:1,4-alpha-glucan branching protein GlgB n=1 Tax=Candidatus Cyanaurora vandensis TaxID=2714958 RepID=UPI00257972FC|nr:1,4-alpha-glucan branching protein GlgB [Candidatus Cyanaurora vandensis]